jgi:hypothetical protein
VVLLDDLLSLAPDQEVHFQRCTYRNVVEGHLALVRELDNLKDLGSRTDEKDAEEVFFNGSLAEYKGMDVVSTSASELVIFN